MHTSPGRSWEGFVRELEKVLITRDGDNKGQQHNL